MKTLKKILSPYYTLIVFLLYSLPSQGQNFVLNKTIFIGGDSCYTTINDAVVTNNNQIMFVGRTTGDNKGDIPLLKPYQKNSNMVLGLLDANFQLLWVKVYGGTNDDEAIKIHSTSDNKFVIAATIKSSDGDISNNYGTSDIWLIKVDTQGNILWDKNFGSSSAETPLSITEDDNGNILILGISNGQGDDIPHHYGGAFSFDWVVLKIDQHGNKLWSKTLGGTGSEDQNGDILAIDSNYYILSATNSIDHDCIDTSWFGSANTDYNYHILKLDTSGAVLWNKSYGGSQGDGIYDALYDSYDTTVLLSGFTNSNDYMLDGMGPGVWMIKIDLDGDTIWTKCIKKENTNFTQRTSLCLSNNNGSILIYNINGSQQSGLVGKQNTRIVAIDKNTIEQSSLIFGSTGYEWTENIIPYLNGYILIGETSEDSFNLGTKLGQKGTGSFSFGFISYIHYWPTNISIQDNTSKILSIYPNPTNNKVTIDYSSLSAANAYISIFNNSGQLIHHKDISNIPLEVTIDTRAWTPGLYTVSFTNGSDTISTNLLIK